MNTPVLIKLCLDHFGHKHIQWCWTSVNVKLLPRPMLTLERKLVSCAHSTTTSRPQCLCPFVIVLCILANTLPKRSPNVFAFNYIQLQRIHWIKFATYLFIVILFWFGGSHSSMWTTALNKPCICIAHPHLHPKGDNEAWPFYCYSYSPFNQHQRVFFLFSSMVSSWLLPTPNDNETTTTFATWQQQQQ